jgi:serine/threonine protein kinase
VLVGADGVCKINDFGLVRLLNVATGRPVPVTVLTKEGMPIGTAAYMSPEAVVGDPTIDQRADQYALAVMSYRMLLGRLPFSEALELLPMLNAQLHVTPPEPTSIDPEFPEAVGAVVMRALRKDRNERYPTVDQYWADLHATASVAWPGWESRANLANLVLSNRSATFQSAEPQTLIVEAKSEIAAFPNVPVIAAIPRLKRRRQRRGRIVSALAGLGISVGIFELFTHVLR